MAVVDIHTHVYPDKLAERATESVGDFYKVPMYRPGSVEGLLDSMRSGPVTHSVIYSVANKASHVETINNFIAETCSEHDEFTGFMTLHQDYPDKEAEIARARSMGLVGIKLHPDSQRVDLDDERLLPVYEIARDEHIPLVIHCGDYRYDYSHPRRMKRVLRMFPGLVVDAAHFGGWSIYDYALEFLEEENCYVDMSSAQCYLGPRRTLELSKIYGIERVLFGSDFPMWSPEGEHRRFTELWKDKGAIEQMTWHNAEEFLGKEVR